MQNLLKVLGQIQINPLCHQVRGLLILSTGLFLLACQPVEPDQRALQAEIQQRAEKLKWGSKMGAFKSVATAKGLPILAQRYQTGEIYAVGQRVIVIQQPITGTHNWPCGLKEHEIPRIVSRHLLNWHHHATQVPGDLVNLLIRVPSRHALKQQFMAAGWSQPSLMSYLEAPWRHDNAFPVSRLFLWGRVQDLAFSRDTSLSLSHRHHLRLWQTPWQCQGDQIWLGAASRDIGIEWSRQSWRSGPTTHLIDPDLDQERQFVLNTFKPFHQTLLARAGLWEPLEGQNGNFDFYVSDGQLAWLDLDETD